MEFFKATRVSIIAERLIKDGVIDILHEEGVTGYSVFDGGGEGSHGLHPVHAPNVVDAFTILKIEVIISDRTVAETVCEKISKRFLKNQSGVIYLHEVEVMRPEKF